MVEFNTKIKFNNKIMFLAEPKNKWLEGELFNLFLKSSKVFHLNNDGELTNTKEKLKEFDIGKDKDFGGWWNFAVNARSIKLIDKTFEGYQNSGHLIWGLKGDGFLISHEEMGHNYSYTPEEQVGPDGKSTSYSYFEIKTKDEKISKKMQVILNSYETC